MKIPEKHPIWDHIPEPENPVGRFWLVLSSIAFLCAVAFLCEGRPGLAGVYPSLVTATVALVGAYLGINMASRWSAGNTQVKMLSYVEQSQQDLPVDPPPRDPLNPQL
jgi:hypothetical protein